MFPRRPTFLQKHMTSGIVALAFLALQPTWADVDRSPKPGGVYKLKPGLFVEQGSRCEDPPNAAIRRYDGRGISTAHTRACAARILTKRRSGYGSLYRVSQTCIDAGEGPGKRFTERQTIDIPDALTFTLKSQGNATFHYCPVNQLPPELRKYAQ